MHRFGNVLALVISTLLASQVLSFGLLSRAKYATLPLNTKNRQTDELRLVTDLFVDSFWQGKVGGGTRQLTETQNRTLQAQQYSEFRKRYARPSMNSQLLVCRDTGKNGNDPVIIGCAGVEIDTVATFAEGSEPRPNVGSSLWANIMGNGIPAKPSGQWDTKMRYAPLMSNLVVSRQYRRKGIAEKLVEDVEDQCLEWGYDECFLFVEKRNAPAVKLYQKLGYKTLWQDDKAQTLIPTKNGELESSATVIICMKKELTSRDKGFSLWPF